MQIYLKTENTRQLLTVFMMDLTKEELLRKSHLVLVELKQSANSASISTFITLMKVMQP